MRGKKVTVSDNIRPYLNEIAERLLSGHAAVMVGAGFSKNSTPTDASLSGFADWKQLGDLFYEKTRGCKPNENKVDANDNLKYLNVLKLADELQAALGRPALDQILRAAVPDKEHEPSPLHIDLLNLPWTDVFTTNYDTLLERARTSVFTRKYDVVVNKEDLVFAQRPRIVKLHGSFPANQPFIITEEDYRRYPQDFAPFVNTVQQALLENTLCLIGFSGDDPNFLQWIGWIRDNLGNHKSSKIYLIGLLNLSVAQQKLLEQRNIVPVDMVECDGVDGDHYRGLERFIEYLSERKAEDNRLGWPIGLNRWFLQPDYNKAKTDQIAELLPEWKKQRHSYPGWVIVPEDRRRKLWIYTKFWIDYVSSKDNLSSPIDLEFAFELNWRMEKCLCPILDRQIELFEALIDNYLIFDQVTKSKKSLPPTTVSIVDKNQIRRMCTHLLLGMMRFYREEGQLEKWKEAESKMERLRKHLSPVDKANLSYERALSAFFTLDIPELKIRLREWQIDKSLPFLEAKRAALLAEIGQIDEAEQIIKQSLINIRSNLNLRPITIDYSLVSQETYVMLMSSYLRDVKTLDSKMEPASANEVDLIKNRHKQDWLNKNEKNKQEHFDNNVSDDTICPRENISVDDDWNELYGTRSGPRRYEWEKLLGDFRSEIAADKKKKDRERWDILTQFKCDPWMELRLFENSLARPPVTELAVIEKPEFDLGRVIRTHYYENWDNEQIIAYGFLRFCEDAGIPLKVANYTIAKNSAEGALSRISKYSPYWVMSVMVRIGDENLINNIFNRETISRMDVAAIDELVNGYLMAIEKNLGEIQSGSRTYRDNFGVVLAKVCPEILSRLCCKCSLDSKNKLINFLLEIYKSDHKDKYAGIGHLTGRLINAFSAHQRFNLIPKLLEFPVLDRLHPIEEREFTNPFHYINLAIDITKDWDKPIISEERIEALFKKSMSKETGIRRWALTTLGELYNLGLLTKEQTEKLSKGLWSNLDSYGLPAQTGYYKFTTLDLPHPDNVTPSSLVKTYIQGENFQIQDPMDEIKLTGGEILLCHEIIGASKYLQWSNEEATSLFKSLVNWWDCDKEYLKRPEISPAPWSIANEFRRRFEQMTDVLVEVIAPRFDLNIESNIKDTLLRLIEELNDYGLPTLRLKSACLHIIPTSKTQLFAEIENSLVSCDPKTVIDSLNATLIIVKHTELYKTVDETTHLLGMLGQKVLWRKQASLSYALKMVNAIVEKYPVFYSGDLEKSVLGGLKNIALDMIQDKVGWEFSEMLSIKQHSAGLAWRLFRLYSTQDKSIPVSIIKWKEICHSDNEFAEIRNQWIELPLLK